jgi:predicted secreted hydrolase
MMRMAKSRNYGWSSCARLALLATLAACGGSDDRHADDGLALSTVLGARDVEGYDRALAIPSLAFPRDHGPHDGFRTEWWYWTGNVADDAGRAFGFELVFFRQALAPAQGGAPRDAALASREIVLAHAAVTNVDRGAFHSEERLLRRDELRAGMTVSTDGPIVWCGDWRAEPIASASSPDRFPPMRLTARGDGFSFDLVVEAQKPLVLQGDRGMSQKSSERGNASIYYSATRLLANGTIEADGSVAKVAGTAWCDREWSTSALGDGQVGWDWFSLQFEDGCELTWYQLRRSDGSIDEHSQGTWIRADGTSERLLASEMVCEPIGEWTASDGRATYPKQWRLRCDKLALDVEVAPRVQDQELRTRVRYWEGAVAVKGSRSGVGYLEMTGYGK